MIVIHGVARSRASRPIWACLEAGLPYRLEPRIQAYRLADPMAADAPANTADPAFRVISPMGEIPVLVDGDLVLTESLAQTHYIATKSGAPLDPDAPADRARALQYSFLAATSIEPDALTILMLHRDGQAQDAGDVGLVDEAATRLVKPLDRLEGVLAQQEWLVGAQFCIADLNMAETLRYAQGHARLMAQFPAVAAWLARCQARPAFTELMRLRAAEPV